MQTKNGYRFDSKRELFLPDEKNYAPARYPLIGGTVSPFRGGAFSPSDIASLTMWIDFDDLDTRTLNGADISQQDDKANGNNCVQTTASEQPLFQSSGINSLGCAELDSSTEEYFDVTDDTLSALTAAEVFIVVVLNTDPPALVATGLWTFGDTGSTKTHFPLNTDEVIYDGFGTTVRKTTVDPTPLLTTPRCYNVVTTSSEWTSELDGTQLFTTGTNTVGFRSTSLRLGANPDASNFLDGQIGELVMFDTKLSAPDKASMETYIEDKWAVTFA